MSEIDPKLDGVLENYLKMYKALTRIAEHASDDARQHRQMAQDAVKAADTKAAQLLHPLGQSS